MAKVDPKDRAHAECVELLRRTFARAGNCIEVSGLGPSWKEDKVILIERSPSPGERSPAALGGRNTRRPLATTRQMRLKDFEASCLAAFVIHADDVSGFRASERYDLLRGYCLTFESAGPFVIVPTTGSLDVFFQNRRSAERVATALGAALDRREMRHADEWSFPFGAAAAGRMARALADRGQRASVTVRNVLVPR